MPARTSSRRRRTAKPKGHASPHRDEIERYCDAITAGALPAGELWRATIARHRSDLETAESRGFVFDWRHADDWIDWFPLLKHSTGQFAGTPFHLELWQKTLVAMLAGWREAETGLRRFRDLFYSVARGNGKSPLAAGIGLKLLMLDDPLEARAHVVCAATKKSQAGIVFNEAKRFLNGAAYLKKHVEIWKPRICFPFNDSVFEPLGSDSENEDGYILHGAIIDELHAWREQHRELLEKIDTAMGKRRQPLKATITTAGSDRSLLWLEAYDYSQKVARGIVDDDRHLSCIFEADRNADPFAVETQQQANPNHGISVRPEYLIGLASKAKSSPAQLTPYRRYHLNQLVSSREKAFPPELWQKGNGQLPDLDGLPCFGGLDLGWRDDLAAFVLCFPLEIDGRRVFAFRVFAWLPRDGARDLQREPFASFARSGLLTITDGNVTDHRAILETVAECRKRYDLRTVAADPNNARAILTELHNEQGIPTFEFFQTCRRYNEPVRQLLDALDEGRVLHGANPLFAWTADNVILRRDGAGYVMPDKDKSSEKIDPVVAALMALSEALFSEHNAPKPTPRIRIV